METNCSWCGKQIGFWDMNYTDEEVDDKLHYICEDCTAKIKEAKNGQVTFDEIATPKTDGALFAYLVNQSGKKGQDGTESAPAKKAPTAQHPLYEDVHQIARDLRFIKNYLIFTIVAGCICAFIWLLIMMG